MEIYQNKFMAVRYNNKLSLMEQKWLNDSKELSKNPSAQSISVLNSIVLLQVEKHRPERVLVNTKAFENFQTSEKATLNVDNLACEYATVGAKKIAFVVPTDVFIKATVEKKAKQNTTNYYSQCFVSEETAKEWLKRK